jgi:hypothetical protein
VLYRAGPDLRTGRRNHCEHFGLIKQP